MAFHKAVKFNASQFETLTDEERKEIHQNTLALLQDQGQVVYHNGALELLKKAGAYIEDGNKVYFPSALVEWAIKSTPSFVNVYDRNGELAMALGGRNAYFGTGSDCPNMLDWKTGERRRAVYQDVIDGVKIVDALPYINFTMCMGLIDDVKKEVSYQHEFAAMVRNTTKPQVITAADVESLDDIVEMAAAVVGGRETLSRKPLFVLYDEPNSPFQHSEEALDKLIYMAENRLPTNYAPGMMAGGTGPITLAGAILQANCEILAGLVIHQLKNPGAPFVYGAGMSNMDMVSMQPTYTSPEAIMSQAGLCSMGRYYNLPTWGFAGCSCSKVPDEQAMYEQSNYNLMAGLMGSNLNHDVGYLEFGLTFSFESLVMNDEQIGFMRRMMDGVRVDDEYMALDAIRRVGPGGNYLGDEHTFSHFKENFTGDITDRNTYDQWQAKGGTTMRERAKAKIEYILENHKPQLLSKEADARIEEILKMAEDRY